MTRQLSITAVRPWKRREGRILRRAILETAAALFAERGYERASMRAIAGRVDITAPALYYHFPNKQTILYHCLEEALLDLLRSGEAALARAGEDPRAKLREFTRALVTFHIGRMDIQAVYETTLYGMGHLVNALTLEQRRRLAELQRRYLDELRKILKEGVDAGCFGVVDVTLTAFALIGMGEHVVTWFHPRGRLTGEEVAAEYAELALRMAGAACGIPQTPGGEHRRLSSTRSSVRRRASGKSEGT